ncbi:be34ec7d-0e68-46fe-bb6a-05f4e13c29ca [Chaetomidium leptoderma]|uniref:Be34ec7d-0e68-46fe-bb6a-05f4e13c29ca n=1 Tax=Chaetomidium leptoderma TaxID=669021 RepID=A0AAN6ZZ82_9PEZI|nr:be34ec7d-0e68-46fe-bb6a-05f4e13c29ca [Chaetomidium leptoderma]
MFPAIHSWKRGEPAQQEYFTFRNGLWYPVEIQGSTIPPGAETPRSFRFSVLSWNIDFMRPLGDARMSAALKHLQSLVSGKPDPSIIMFNEMTKSDLGLIKRADWVRDGYNITDASTEHWEAPSYGKYITCSSKNLTHTQPTNQPPPSSGITGTCMLIPHTLPIKSLFRVHYERTSMQRDALLVDVALPQAQTLRLCTSHLESLRATPPKRPSQLATAARYLREAHAGVIGGDLNAIESFDRTLHAENDLKDAYLENGGVEGEEGGMTWGQMAGRAGRERFGLSRMDKILFCGGVKLVGFEMFGMDVVVEGEEAAEHLLQTTDLEKPWVTDHLGVRAEFVVEMPEPVGEEGTTQEGTTEAQQGTT